jgi:hypothetical protein
MIHTRKLPPPQLMEMILGALGRDAVGLGAGMAHPRESEEWRGMDMMQRYAGVSLRPDFLAHHGVGSQ